MLYLIEISENSPRSPAHSTTVVDGPDYGPDGSGLRLPSSIVKHALTLAAGVGYASETGRVTVVISRYFPAKFSHSECVQSSLSSELVVFDHDLEADYPDGRVDRLAVISR